VKSSAETSASGFENMGIILMAPPSEKLLSKRRVQRSNEIFA